MDNITNENFNGANNQIVPNVKTRPFLGVIGAIIGALLGAGLWVLLYQLGVIAGIAGIAIAFLACKGYALLSKSQKLGGVIISALIALVVLIITNYLCWAIQIYNELQGEFGVTFFEAIELVPTVAFTEELVVDFFKEYLIGIVLIIIGTIPFIRNAKQVKLNENRAAEENFNQNTNENMQENNNEKVEENIIH